jgi:hypothetical protein
MAPVALPALGVMEAQQQRIEHGHQLRGNDAVISGH